VAVNCVFYMKKRITVLIADDNRFVCEGLKTILTSGIDSLTIAGIACNGEEAIEMTDALNPDIILMDINMKPVNGYEATRKILLQHPGIKIIGISMNNEVSYARNIMRLGARGYIIKSASAQEIINAVKIVAEGGKYIDKALRDKF
jgi:two-component system, NarL family, invasion response regulator UvrY